MLRWLLYFSILSAAVPGVAEARARVAATDLIAAASRALHAQAAALKIDAKFAVVGRVADLQLPQDGKVVLSAVVPERWLRPRIAVPVRVELSGHKESQVTIWFSVSALVPGLVYAENFPRGALDTQVSAYQGRIDLAKTNGKTLTSLNDISGQRLRQPRFDGQPVQVSDFEMVPMILAQQKVQIKAVSGAVRLVTSGRALVDGEVGQVVFVLPENAPHPVRARVVSRQVVLIEH